MKSIRGVNDFFGSNSEKFTQITEIASKVSKQFGFQRLITPTIEYSSLFERNLGDSDIASKEIYKFEDKSGEMIALRPEFTAGVVRAVCENGDLKNGKLPLKLFSFGQVFRYERPQKGRYRELNQINFEIFGKPLLQYDIDIILIARDIISSLGIKNAVLNMNFIGGLDSKNAYTNYLNEYFGRYKNDLSQDSQKRLEVNKSLRILDSKDENDKKISLDVKPISDFYDTQTKVKIEKFIEILTSLNVPFELNPSLVRGLDYYTDLVFEFISEDLESKSQNAVCGGGRYDKMVSQISDNKMDLCAVGFAAGVERLIHLCNLEAQKTQKMAIIPVSSNEFTQSFQIREKVKLDSRFQDFHIEIICDDFAVSKNMKKASESGFDFICVIGEDEVESGTFDIKNLSDKSIIKFTL
ncbi:histidine--tRNA ligase [Candidatus Deianiraea vastatrix]|uniref:Histidine--tRNA ligase n=1 Tax=Candidatus Deianiraea vastatrix TaxID=2163644 RepID=A0A5B8XH44_9RICK|nr:histidine--tRNA ligase [Candidatus Deianiraea vastatrix]QED23177.1 Histidine--tRNA ligase [Candidatus Deianiraea vastatrix]